MQEKVIQELVKDLLFQNKEQVEDLVTNFSFIYPEITVSYKLEKDPVDRFYSIELTATTPSMTYHYNLSLS